MLSSITPAIVNKHILDWSNLSDPDFTEQVGKKKNKTPRCYNLLWSLEGTPGLPLEESLTTFKPNILDHIGFFFTTRTLHTTKKVFDYNRHSKSHDNSPLTPFLIVQDFFAPYPTEFELNFIWEEVPQFWVG